ncbi:hypothetical protein GGS20DRAFT_539544 [Poronia punctata]|nr:hypothetical protein GGS20DRAFT_539544 [Poronia punctata]
MSSIVMGRFLKLSIAPLLILGSRRPWLLAPPSPTLSSPFQLDRNGTPTPDDYTSLKLLRARAAAATWRPRQQRPVHSVLRRLR